MTQHFSSLGIQPKRENPDTTRIVDGKMAKFSDLRMPKINNKNFYHYCEI